MTVVEFLFLRTTLRFSQLFLYKLKHRPMYRHILFYYPLQLWVLLLDFCYYMCHNVNDKFI